MSEYDIFLRLGMALAIGFAVGLERGWQEREEEEGQRTAGLRTFTLIGLLGGVLGAVSQHDGGILLGNWFCHDRSGPWCLHDAGRRARA